MSDKPVMEIMHEISVQTRLSYAFKSTIKGPMSLTKALLIAVLAHSGQEDKGQNSYIRHPLRVMEKMDSEDEMICAVLHDVAEDTPITLNDLAALGLTTSQVKCIDALTKREGEEYQDRVERVANSTVARKIKVADIRDNMQLHRLKNKTLTEKDVVRQQNYINALVRLGAIDDK